MNTEKLKKQLRLHEGVRHEVYFDTRGIPTIGVGRNLKDNPLSDDEVDFLLASDVRRVADGLDESVPWWRGLSEVRQRVLADMAFNLGMAGLLSFGRMLARLEEGDHTGASREMLDSRWARQVGERATRLSEMMATGRDYVGQ